MPDTIETAIYRLRTEGQEGVEALTGALDRNVVSQEKATRATRTTVDGLERMIAGLDKRVQAEQRLARQLEQLQRYEQEGVGTASRRAVALDLVTKRYNEQSESVTKVASRLAELTAKFDPATTSAQKMAKELADLNQAQRLGITIAGGYDAAFRRITETYDEGAQAAKRAAQAKTEFIAKAKEEQAVVNAGLNASAAQARYNQQLGVSGGGGGSSRPPGGTGSGLPPGPGSGGDPKSARESAAYYEQITAAAQKYRDQLNPLLPLQRAYRAELETLSAALKIGDLDQKEYAVSLDQVKRNFSGLVQEITGVTQAEETATRVANERAASAQAIKDKIDPLSRAQREYRAELQQLNALSKSGDLDQRAYAAALDQTKRNFTGLVKEITGVTQAEEMQAQITKRLAADARALEDRINPLGVAQRRYAAEVASANTLLAKGAISREARDAEISRAKNVLDEYGKSNRGGASDQDLAAKSARQMGAAMTNLSFQVNDVVSGLISGQQPLRIMAQQGGQIFQVFQQAPGGVAGAMAATRAAVVSMVSPTTIAVAAFATLAVGVGYVISKMVEAETRMRSFRVTLDSMGTSGLASAADLEKVVERLRDTGSTVTAATAAVQGIARTPQIDPSAIGRIADVARNISAARGLDFSSTATGLAKAIADGDEALLKYAQDMGVRFTPAEQAAIATLLKHRDAAGLVRVEFDALVRTFDGDFEKSLSATAKLVNSLDAAWNGLIKTIGDTGVFQSWLAGAKGAIQQIDDLIAGRAGRGGFAMSDEEFRRRFAPPPGAAAFAEIPPAPALVPQGITGPMAEVPALQAQQAKTAAAGNGLTSPTGISATELAKQTAEIVLQSQAYGKLGLALIEVEARITATRAAEALKIIGTEKDTFVTNAVADAVNKHNKELAAGVETQRITNALALDTAKAYGVNLVAGLEAAAAAQAKLDVRSGAASNEAERRNLLLRTAAAEAIKSTSEQIAANDNLIKAQERLATATAMGTAAGRAQEVENEAIAKTEDTVAKALATRNDALIKVALAERELVKAQDARKESLAQSTQALQAANDLGRQAQVGRLEASLVGSSPEDAARAVALLQGAQQLADRYATATVEAKEAYAGQVANLANVNRALVKAREENERTQAVFKGIASNIESTLGTAIDDIFAGKKIDDWGARLKSMFASIQSTIAKETLLKPLIGTGLKLFGASDETVKQYGTIKGLFDEPKDATGAMVTKLAQELPAALKNIPQINVSNMKVEAAEIALKGAIADATATGAMGGGGAAGGTPQAGLPAVTRETLAAPSGTGGATSALTGPITQAEAGTAEAALQQAMTHEGERLEKWCAKLVNEALDAAGVPGTTGPGKNLASSFKTFGTAVDPSDVRRGDVFYSGPSGWGDTGHVGFATGPVQDGRVPVFSSHKQGDPNNPAGSEWRNAENLTFRRPDYTATAAAAEQATKAEEQETKAKRESAAASMQAAQATGKANAAADEYAGGAATVAYQQKNAATAAENLGQQTGVLRGTTEGAGSSAAETATQVAAVKTSLDGAGGSATTAAAGIDATKQSSDGLGDSAQKAAQDLITATQSVTGLSTGTSDLTLGLDAANNSTKGYNTTAAEAATIAGDLSSKMGTLGDSARKAVGDLDALDISILQSAVGAQQASAGFAAAGATAASAGSSAGSSTGSFSSLGSALSSASRAGSGGLLNNLSSIGGLFDKASSLFGGSSGGSSGGGLFGNLFGSSSSGGSSGGSSFFNNPFGLFGEKVQDFGGGGFGTPGTGAFDTTVPGSLFGDTTFGEFTGGVGLGFSAGSLLNGLVGGNKMFGTIGSGIGSIAGSFLGPIGGLIGGALGGLLGGMFGAKKPSNASAGGNIDFTTGQVTGTFTGGNSQIDQATLSVVKDVGSFTKNLLKMTGGTLTGNALIQNGVNTGFTVDSSVPGYEGRFKLGKDATEAARVIELALARTLTNVSDTMKTVIKSVTDPAQLQDAIQFASVYDNLKKAYDSAFSSIDQDTKAMGPFGTALEQLNATFKDLTDKAGQYGLALEPVTAGLAEATKRLKSDFKTSLSQQEQQLAGGTDFLGAALQAHKAQVANWSDAVSLGFDDATTKARVHSLEVAQLGTAFSGLSLGQLQDAVKAFAETAPEVSQFAQNMINIGQYLSDPIDRLILAITDPITAAIGVERLAGEQRLQIATATGQGQVKVAQYNQLLLNQIWDQATQSLVQLRADLTTGQSSGLTAAQQSKAANDNFNKELALVQAGNLGELANLSSAGSSAIQLSQQTYGNAPQTAALRDSIVAAINAVLAAGIPQSAPVPSTATSLAEVANTVAATVTPSIAAMTDASVAATDAAASVADSAASVADSAAAVADAAATAGATGAVSATDLSGALDLSGSAATGMTSTPPGTILVGEEGPELISQSGGLRIFSNPDTRRIMSMHGRAFADGTDHPVLPAAPRQTAPAANNDELVAEVRALREQVTALLAGANTIARAAGQVAEEGFNKVHGAVKEGAKPSFEVPVRRRA